MSGPELSAFFSTMLQLAKALGCSGIEVSCDDVSVTATFGELTPPSDVEGDGNTWGKN